MGEVQNVPAACSEQINKVLVRIAVVQSDVSWVHTKLADLRLDIRELREDIIAIRTAVSELRSEIARQRVS